MKKGDKRFIKNWKPISLLYVDLKTISETLSEKLNKVSPDLISSYFSFRIYFSFRDLISYYKIKT